MEMKTTKFLVAICALALTGASFAGIKYWDNQAFKAYDAGDYVQNGLVLNYDGIRNAGPSAGHDPAATTWKNLGSGGAAYDMSIGGSATSSAWGDDGFVFAGDAYFKSASKQALPEYYEVQTLVDAKASDAPGIGYIYTRVFADSWNSSDTAWNGSSICVRPTWSETVSGTTYKGSLVFNTHYYTASQARPLVPVAITTYDYVTALGDSKGAALFTGLDVPTEMPGYADPASGSWAARAASYIYIGGHDNGSGVGEALHATVKNFRYYSRILSGDERAWNRVVDEARYFGRGMALPVTNVVIASNIPIATGEEPVGCYAVDGSHVFSAPASKIVKGRNYTLDGFTIETWNGSAWGDPVQHPGETSYAATDSALVRLTWQWTPGDGLVRYDADDYVQYGLVLNYDGICNAGLGVPHDSAATTWANLGNGGSEYDMTRYSFVDSAWTEGAAQGEWTDAGFVFGKNSVFTETKPILIPTRRTMQILVDAKASSQGGIGDVVGCHDGTKWDYFSICMRSNGTIANSFYIPVFGSGNVSTSARPAIYNEAATYDYGTAIVNGNDAVWFSGTTAPWAAADTGGTTGHLKKGSLTMTEWTDSGISLGGRYPSQDQRFTGTIKSFRFYDRCLSDAEVVWNRVVDDWRYSGSAVVNVVVASTRADVQANEADGEYQVSGSYTFTAPASVTVGNITYEPAGYAIQPWSDADGCWGAATEYEGASYAYTIEAGKVRLLWRWKAVRGIRTAADYDVSDYVAGGLVLNFDGIRNAGAAVGHDPSATTWVNLGTDGATRNAPISKTGDLSWTANGYTFDGTRKFVVPATGVGTASHTVQFLTDAIQNEQQNPSSATIYFFSGVADYFAGATYGGSFYYRILGAGNDLDLRFTFDKATPIGYATLMTDAAAKKAYAFQGDAKPTTAPGVKSYDSISAPSFGELAIGGWGGGTGQYMKGTINCFRYYDRVLSDDELAQNRQVDAARYFGALGATNVLVVAGGGTQSESGTYKVEGEWTFTAATVVNARGETVPVERHSVETLVNGAWTNKQIRDGDTYTYIAGSSPATVRLRWLGRPEGITLILR